MDEFEKREEIGRRILLENVESDVTDINFTNYKYETYDGTLTGKTGKTALFEIKNRNVSITDYSDKGWLIEEKKAKPMLEESKDYDLCLYITITREALLMWDLKKTPLTFFDLPCTKTTATGYHKGEVMKSVATLNTSDALCIRRRRDR